MTPTRSAAALRNLWRPSAWHQDRPDQCHSVHEPVHEPGADAGEAKRPSDLGAGERVRTAGLPFKKKYGLMALAALGLSGATFYEPFHAGR
jgi:hypothetical protein